MCVSSARLSPQQLVTTPSMSSSSPELTTSPHKHIVIADISREIRPGVAVVSDVCDEGTRRALGCPTVTPASLFQPPVSTRSRTGDHDASDLALLALILKSVEAATSTAIVLASFAALQLLNGPTTSTAFTPRTPT